MNGQERATLFDGLHQKMTDYKNRLDEAQAEYTRMLFRLETISYVAKKEARTLNISELSEYRTLTSKLERGMGTRDISQYYRRKLDAYMRER